MHSDLTHFGLGEMLRCGLEVRRAATGATTLEGGAQRICRYLYEELRGSDGERATVLVRCYKTHPYAALDPTLQEFARGQLPPGIAPWPQLRCLTLLATVGDEPAWNSRLRSAGHRAIPLPSAELVERAPMIAQLVRQFGLDVAHVVQPPGPAFAREAAGKTYGVFHVEQAHGSPYIPAQNFVLKHGVQSVLGFGGALASGELFAIILFAKVVIPPATATRFRNLALDVKASFYSFNDAATFEKSE